ncbi:MAG: membrane integrity-associated transporter subunit PqiC [Gammaproteobacteria bacterium]|nr:membrane integrity-associated transporter subunit PqiC [Gammaproteobacteria bacterium]
MNLSALYKIIFLILFSSGVLFLSGCGTSQKTDFYKLEESGKRTLLGVEQGKIIGVGPVHIPEYLNRPQIVTRTSLHHMNVSEFNRWVEPITDSINRLLVINLSNNMSSNRVYWVPRQDRQYPLDIRIAIDIGRFDGQLGEEVSLEARWSIFDKDEQPVLTKVSLITEPVKGTNYNELVIAMNRAIQTLGKEISQASIPFLEE